MIEQLALTTALGLGLYVVVTHFMQAAVNEKTKGCQFCKSRIHKEATACPHCGRDQAE